MKKHLEYMASAAKNLLDVAHSMMAKQKKMKDESGSPLQSALNKVEKKMGYPDEDGSSVAIADEARPSYVNEDGSVPIGEEEDDDGHGDEMDTLPLSMLMRGESKKESSDDSQVPMRRRPGRPKRY